MRGAWLVFRKEVRETLRDWRTLLMMVALPVLLYPVILIMTEQMAVMGMRRVAAQGARVAISGAPETMLRRFRDDERIRLVAAPPDGAGAVREGSIDAVARVDGDATAASMRVEIVYDETNERSQRAYELVRQRLAGWSDTLLVERLAERGLPPGFARPVDVTARSVAAPSERGGYWLGRFLPLLLIVMTVLGAFYPAIDLAAGEKERGTLETLLTAPVPASQIVAGKFITVAAVGLLAAGLNLASMLLTFQVGLFRLPEQLGIEIALPAGAVALIFLALIPLAVLFGAVFLGLAVRAQSFKEAQNALTPVYVAVLVPSMLPLMPGIEFTPGLAVVPVAGVAMLFRELMSGGAEPLPSILALISTVGYAALALVFAARAFGREEVLFGGGAQTVEGGGWRERVTRWREREVRVPSVAQALMLVAAVAALSFYVGRSLAAKHAITGLIIAEWGVLFLPAILFVLLGRFDVRRTLGLRMPGGSEWLGAVLIAAGALPIAWFLAWLQSFFLAMPEEMLRAIEALMREQSDRLWLLLFAFAVTPAICEEVVFRGVLLGASRGAMRGWQAIFLNAAIFGAFHVSSETIFRLLPSAWLGLVLAWVVWRTRSVALSAAMHFINNGAIAILAAYPLLADRLGAEGRPPLPLAPLGITLLVLGAWLITRRAPSAEGDG